MVQRFYDLDDGSLSLDNNDIQGLNLPFVRSKLGIVSQEPVLFNKTIAENIQYGDNSRQGWIVCKNNGVLLFDPKVGYYIKQKNSKQTIHPRMEDCEHGGGDGERPEGKLLVLLVRSARILP